jgi:pilus assembly protein CpaB
MSKGAGIIVLIFALISGLIASATVMKFVKQKNTTAEVVEIPKDSVWVCKQIVPAGTRIQTPQVELVQRDPANVPETSMKSEQQAVGRITKTTIYPGEIILENRLVAPNSPYGLPALIPTGMRAITLRVDDTTSVAGFVRPGHHVDVLTTVDVGEGLGGTVAKTILQNVKVIATGREIENDEETKKQKVIPTVTVLVSLEQAERIALATNAGTIRLVLRSHEDVDEIMTEGVSLANLVPSAVQEVVMAPPELVEEDLDTQQEAPGHIIEVLRGKSRLHVSFSN